MATRRGPVTQAQEILLAAGRQAAATDPDRAVVMLAEAVHAAFCAGDAAAMLRAAQLIPAVVPPDSAGRTAFFALFARARHAVAGWSPRPMRSTGSPRSRWPCTSRRPMLTRETAAALFLSPKTIEYHLHNIYRKLAISSRRELAGAMTRASR